MKPIFNRAPLVPNTLSPLPLGSVKPEGWLRDQLETLRDSLAGLPDAALTAPEALEGLVALAWALDEDSLKVKATLAVEQLIASQREDGWFGPGEEGDYWPRMAALRALRRFFTATGDKRVLVLMDRFFKYQVLHLNDRPLSGEAVARGGENMEMALWLYNITGQKHLIELCRRLRAQTLDWPNYFHTFPNPSPLSRTLRWSRLEEALEEEKAEQLEGEKRPYFHTQYHLTHGVNIAMGLKTPGVINLFKSGFKEQGGFKFGWEKLTRYHGLANGMFSCDDHLNGANPAQGSRVDAVEALMGTLESLIGLGEFDPDLADILEKLAYNALPAAYTADMTARQRLEQVNQVKVSDEPRKWYNAEDDANLFAPVADCGAGWPLFAAAQWYATADGGLQAVSYAPCAVRTNLGGVPVRLRVSGGYPFSQSVQLQVDVKQPCEFPVYLRVPAWARQPMIFLPDGEIMQVRSGELTCVRRRWRSGDVVRLELPTVPRVTKWYHQSGAVELGPLLMACQPREQWTQLEGGAWAVETDGDWRWALVRDEPMKAVYGPEAAAFGKGEAPVKVLVKAGPVDWPMDGASAGSLPMVPLLKEADVRVIELVPYGQTALRIAQFPLGKDGRKSE